MYAYSWVDVYVCEGVYVLYVCRETDIIYFCQLLSTSLFEINLAVNLDLHQFIQTSWSGALGALLSLTPQHWDYNHLLPCLTFNVGSKNPN